MVATAHPIKNTSDTVHYFYYVEKNFEASKEWVQNKASEALGLKELTKDNLSSILKGQISKDVALGKKTETGLEHKAGEELIFSAPKSVSILALVAEDERLIDAHEKAVRETIKYLEKTVIQTRIQEDGKKRLENTGNAPIAKFTHIAARPSKDPETKEYRIPDPQLHTHCLIANATLCKDNQWRSIEFKKLYEDKMLLGELYRMELGREVEKLGYEVEKCTTDDVSKRQSFHIKGVSENVMLDFSKRRQDILKAAEDLGRFDAKALDFAAKVSRGEKIDMDRSELKSFWKRLQRWVS